MDVIEMVISHPDMKTKEKKRVILADFVKEVLRTLSVSIGEGANGAVVSFEVYDEKVPFWVPLGETKKGGMYGGGRAAFKPKTQQTETKDVPQTDNDQPEGI